MELSQRVQKLTPSSTLAITAKANELKAAGQNVIGLAAGEPDFNTPENIIQAAFKAVEAGKTKYTPAGGLPKLKEAIQEKLERDEGLRYELNEIMVASGAKHALYNLFQSILDEGDEVIIPIPFWVSYPEQVKLAGGEPVYVTTDESTAFKVTTDKLDGVLSEKTKAIILNTPSNPTGAIYSKEELQAVADWAVKNQIIVVSDEIYETLVYDGEHISIAALGEDIKKLTVIINGVSKSHSMTGWRIGYAAGDRQLIKAMTDLASHSTSNPTTPSQWAAIEAYDGDQTFLREMNKTFKSRLDTIYPQLMEIPGIECIKPKGAFYLYPNVKETVRLCGLDSADEFVEQLLETSLVAVVPGSSFGSPDNIRLSYATDLDSMTEAIRRIKQFVEERMEK
ncbi:pyridoxal phosphate-dependent aminotransferase [Macrococcus brunensis]|uniref:Aminotransferase n=1 Tax=Macrococcus brunensis TaxID=198483 RepID=A0A4R6BDJ4_9STAP|nr:pyridoxal phosphate-dependent aminotransferase [Macrococcus brunensis]TDL97799.1 pyridoxal phosphate-dependent aminotransferase [Macrococcus brunensis]ULG73344.1 pyridoxal phosphate-dependent aminotransferase [Macrococcus brunensis]